jgi:hypothetical protein
MFLLLTPSRLLYIPLVLYTITLFGYIPQGKEEGIDQIEQKR